MPVMPMFPLLVVFALLRPAIKAVQPPPAADPVGQTLDALVDGDEALPGLAAPAEPVAALPPPEPPRSHAQLEQARQMVKDNPAAVAGIVRDWVNGPVAEKVPA